MARRKKDNAPTKRERFFECVFAADRSEYRFHLRAWTPEEAAYHLDEELREAGLAIPGQIRILDSRGKTVLSLEYTPPSRAPRSRGDEQR
jgi:hypothetical protein